MNCLFCKNISDNSSSVEHIIPESLGNKEHVLPKGIVCDQCNQYFAIKIEKEVLEQGYFKYARSIQNIETKKGKIVPADGFIVHPEGGKIEIYKENNDISIGTDNNTIINLIRQEKINKLYVPHYFAPTPENIPLSRLLGKMALEVLAGRAMQVDNWQKDIVYKTELDPLRQYVRYGPNSIKFWHYHQRILYTPEQLFEDTQENSQPFEILHEYTLHYSEANELFFIVAIFGIEYAINMAGPDIETYVALLDSRNGRSILEVDHEKKWPQ